MSKAVARGLLQRPCHATERESRRGHHGEGDEERARDVARHGDDRREQTDQGPLRLHAADVDREEDRDQRDDPAPVIRSSVPLFLCQPLAEADQVRMIRQPKLRIAAAAFLEGGAT